MVLLIASIATFMGPFDANIVNLALPAIGKALGATFTDIILIIAAYLVVLASLQLVFGKLGDGRGIKNIFIFGLAVFTVGSFLAGLSQGVAQLISFRIFQGIGNAVLSALGGALIAITFPGPDRGRMFGIIQGVAYSGLTAGPAAGGFLVQFLGWRSIFYVNVPIGIVTMILSIVYLRNDKVNPRPGTHFDFLGAITLTSSLVTMLLILSGLGLSTLELSGLSLACIFSFVGFILVERRNGITPLMDLSLFTRNRLFAAGNATALMNYLTSAGSQVLISLYLQFVLGYSPFNAGLVLLTQPAVMAVVAPLSGVLSERINARVLCAIGMLVRIAGFIPLSLLGISSPIQAVWIPFLVVGAGHAFFSSPNVASVMGSVESDQVGVASGTLGTMRSTGQSIGVPLLGSIVAASMPVGAFAALENGGSVSASIAQLFVTGMDKSFLLAAILSAVGIFTSLVRGKEHRITKTK